MQTVIAITNTKAVKSNSEAVEAFFGMYGDDTQSHHSSRLFEVMAVMQEHYFNSCKSLDEIEDLLFDFEDLNRLVTSLQNPAGGYAMLKTTGKAANKHK